MYTGYVDKMLETLTIEEQDLISVLSVICKEGLYVNVACDVLMPDWPREFNSLIDGLSTRDLIFCDCQTIYIEQSVAEVALKNNPVKSNVAVRLLASLTKYIVLQPLDDMLSRQQYFVVARLILTYLMNNWVLYANNNIQLMPLFSNVAVAFAANVELSFYGNKRQPVCTLEDRIDFKLLNLLKEFDGLISRGHVYRLLGELFVKTFRYDEAKECFEKAMDDLNEDADLLLAQAVMYENLGIQAKAFQFAYHAYLINQENWKFDANIKVILYIAYLCAINESYGDCKYWRKCARSSIGGMVIPVGHMFSITLKEIEALIHIGDATLAHQILDTAELEVSRLYGLNAPEMSRIHYIRCLIDGEVGMLRKSNEHYLHYCETNHYNYGYSRGDTAILYSVMISDHVLRGNNDTANILAVKMQELHAEDYSIAPGVRWGQAIANSISCLADNNLDMSKAYLEVAQEVYDEELCPDEDTLSEISLLFKGGYIPKSVLLSDECKSMKLCNINICLEDSRISEAKELIKEQANKETDGISRMKWNIHMGRALILEGRQDEAVELWWSSLNKMPKREKFEVSKEMADWAIHFDMEYEARKLYEVALSFDIMTYAKSSDLAEVLQSYAQVLNSCGAYGSEDFWEQSALLMQSLGDDNGLALLYFFWGVSQRGVEAESLLMKAIDYWKPEGSVDETLSKMYYHLCCAQVTQGNIEEAMGSAREAVRLYPVNFPVDMLENIEAFL